MIKILQPDMPNADELRPYLLRIDESKSYANRSGLVIELEKRLSEMCGVSVVTTSTGTAALTLALKHYNYFVQYVDVPALTFCGTGLAIRNAGLIPVLRDVNTDLQMHPDCRSGQRAIMMPVATFGRPVDQTEWESFNMPVVIDAAGAFPAQPVSRDKNVVTCFSMHATKFIGAGEGGFIASADEDLLANVIAMSMFGPHGINAKMSEYHAAVALASLDRMPEKVRKTRLINNWYDDYAGKLKFYGVPWGSNTLKVVVLPVGVVASEISERLLHAGVMTKQWYRPWLDERDDFAAHCQLPVTDNMRHRLLGLPFHTGLMRQDVAWVMKKLKEAILILTKGEIT